MLTLTVEKRIPGKGNDTLREMGKIPAVFYGPKNESTPVSIALPAFTKILKEAGESTVITLSLDGDTVDVLVHEVDFDPVTSEPIHADFYAIDKNKKVQVSVPLEFVGVSIAVKELGGTLIKVLHEIEIEALPGNLPHKIEVDISKLATLHSSLSIKDISFPTGVVPMAAQDDVIVSVAEQKEEPEEPVAPIDLTQIEVEKKGKKEEEGETEAPKE